jgi:uncharacterized protein (DUF885 family)
MNSLDRRSFLAAGAAALLGEPVLGGAASADSTLDRLLERHAAGFLIRSPEEATRFEWDTGAHAALRARLDDRSLAALDADRVAIARARSDLLRIERAALSPRAALDYDVAAFVYDTFSGMLALYGFIDIDLRPSPYVVSQMNGAYYWLPDFIGTTHPLETQADLDAWFARLQALAAVLDQETERVRHDAGLGVVPPDFVIALAVAQIRKLRDTPAQESALLAPAITRARSAGLGEIGPHCEDIFRQRVAPALERQAAALQALAPQTGDIAGVWRLPKGADYYAAALRANTTVDTTPDELHREGLEQCAGLLAEIDAGLKGQGLSRGTVTERLARLDVDPRFLVTPDDAGRARLIAGAERELQDIVRRLPQDFNDPVVGAVRVERVPAAIEGGAPLAFYNEGIGGKPGALMLNLERTQDLPLWRLATLVHHEGVPGHHFQFGELRRARSLQLFRKVVRFSSYTEGYALYAQQVADEIGAFQSDPFGRIGYLQSELFRAARIVVDTGLHHKRWTREQAVRWIMEHAGEQQMTTEREVVRYAVYPGQACSFKVGANSIVAAREAARQRLGPKFDVRRFHAFLLRSGPMPMKVLASAAERMA